MANAEQIPPASEHEPTPVRAAVVVYATFALLVLTIPQSLVNWLHDMEENPAQQVLLRAAGGVQAASHAVGLDIPYRRARAAFQAWIGKDDE
jgi:tripartite-type tricarboxylate transporter receptor subunit TctC